MTIRPEDQSYANLQLARKELGELWPEPATSELYYALRTGARNIIASKTGRRDDVLSFEIATKVILDLNKFHGHSRFSTWFYRLTINYLLSSINRAKTRQEIPLEELAELSQMDSKDMTRDDIMRSLRSYAHLVRPEELTLVELMIDGFSREEIAKKLDISETGVAQRWRRLREKLNSRLNS